MSNSLTKTYTYVNAAFKLQIGRLRPCRHLYTKRGDETGLPHTHTTSRYCSRPHIIDDVGKIDVLRIFKSCLLYRGVTRCTAHLDRDETKTVPDCQWLSRLWPILVSGRVYLDRVDGCCTYEEIDFDAFSKNSVDNCLINQVVVKILFCIVCMSRSTILLKVFSLQLYISWFMNCSRITYQYRSKFMVVLKNMGFLF